MIAPLSKAVNVTNLYEFSLSISEMNCAPPKFANNEATIDCKMFYNNSIEI